MEKICTCFKPTVSESIPYRDGLCSGRIRKNCLKQIQVYKLGMTWAKSILDQTNQKTMAEFGDHASSLGEREPLVASGAFLEDEPGTHPAAEQPSDSGAILVWNW